ncbi:MAG: tRNA lysidine(34) synthetase TilS [Paenibacillus sp.]|jgi:tRNA(Ile)-lysidine synthase|uniref:tRNA lysidine(34) synthetase TilS n=1 Tax=Paenibacillus sp. TaxID=58172 RepID=UPI002904D1EE|nr:tRNA lysidine(34) synthetase TilS [Paenibacillus sp.]MDU2239621.1 tRNA lysidine(34) synthetase TilS [Paenibacillus sp.]
MKESMLYRLTEQVRRTGRQERLWSPGDVIVVAVSGGVDSTALLHIMKEIAADEGLGLHLVCAHLHHGLRGIEADRDAEFVRELAERLGIPFDLGHADVRAYMKETGKGLELAAREKRYEYLHQVAERYGASSIALAHHADDQAETVLMRLLRGSGPSGLSGMRPKRREKNVELIRPLLRIYKTDLLQACRESGLAFVEDSSNLDKELTRNSVRLDVLPFLGQYNGQLPESLNRLAELAAAEDDYLQLETSKAYADVVRTEEGILSFSASLFATLHVALQRRLIKLILNYLPLSTEDRDFVKIEAIRQGTIQDRPTTWSLDLGGGVKCVREYDMIRMIPPAVESRIPHYTYLVEQFPAEVPIEGTGQSLRMMRLGAGREGVLAKAEGNNEAIFDADEMVYPLTVRSRLPGDAMKVLGLNGSKKVKDIFIDAKIPPSLRSRIPIVTDATGRILWIPGVRRSAVAAVNPRTTSVVHMVLTPR